MAISPPWTAEFSHQLSRLDDVLDAPGISTTLGINVVWTFVKRLLRAPILRIAEAIMCLFLPFQLGWLRIRVLAAPILPSKRQRFRKMWICAATSVCTIAGGVVAAYLQGIWLQLPTVNAETIKPIQSIRLLDRKGREFYRVYEGEDRTAEKSENLPLHLKNAIIAIEDERYYRRPCVDVLGVMRALWVNATQDQLQGASTITQQLVRNAYLTPEKTITRKIQEAWIACGLEREMGRDEILTLYLNRVPFGSSLHGVSQAARTYFGVETKDLTLAQSVALASLPQRPSYYSPYGSHVHTTPSRDILRKLRRGEIAIEDIGSDDLSIGLLGRILSVGDESVYFPGRSDAVLQNMKRLGYIDERQFELASNELKGLTFQPRSPGRLEAAHFTLLVRGKVQRMMDENGQEESWSKAGLGVSTTLDADLQHIAEQTIGELFPEISKKSGAQNVAMLAIDRKTREVLAYVGSQDFFDDANEGKIDMVQAPRQPGSSFKPLVYAAAFLKGYTSKTIIWDSSLTIGGATPKNYDGSYLGPVPIRIALAWSRNIPAIRAFLHAGGEDPVLAMAAGMGAPTPALRKQANIEKGKNFKYSWPLALGAAEVPLIEMVQAYATLAEGGVFLPLRTIREIDNVEGDPLYTMPIEEGRQAVPKPIADDITSIISDAGSRPGGFWRSQLTVKGMTTGVKTGTSNLCFRRLRNGTCVKHGTNNTWTIGFNDKYVVGVWVGNADNSPLAYKADGLTTAAPIWKTFLVKAELSN